MKIGGREEQEQGGGQNPILEAILFIPHFLLEKDGLYLALVHSHTLATSVGRCSFDMLRMVIRTGGCNHVMLRAPYCEW